MRDEEPGNEYDTILYYNMVQHTIKLHFDGKITLSMDNDDLPFPFRLKWAKSHKNFSSMREVNAFVEGMMLVKDGL